MPPEWSLNAAAHIDRVRQRRLTLGHRSRICRGDIFSISLDPPAPSACALRPWGEEQLVESDRVTGLVMAQVEQRGLTLMPGSGHNELRGSYYRGPFRFAVSISVELCDEPHSGRSEQKENKWIGLSFISSAVAAAHFADYTGRLERLRPRWTESMHAELAAAYEKHAYLLQSLRSSVLTPEARAVVQSWPCGFWDAVAAAAAIGVTGRQCQHQFSGLPADAWVADELSRLMLLGAREDARRLAATNSALRQIADEGFEKPLKPRKISIEQWRGLTSDFPGRTGKELAQTYRATLRLVRPSRPAVPHMPRATLPRHFPARQSPHPRAWRSAGPSCDRLPPVACATLTG